MTTVAVIDYGMGNLRSVCKAIERVAPRARVALAAAARLYESSGFQLTEENTHKLWGTVVTEQRYDLILS